MVMVTKLFSECKDSILERLFKLSSMFMRMVFMFAWHKIRKTILRCKIYIIPSICFQDIQVLCASLFVVSLPSIYESICFSQIFYRYILRTYHFFVPYYTLPLASNGGSKLDVDPGAQNYFQNPHSPG
eukprot:343509_1